jgi:hypothetical protein
MVYSMVFCLSEWSRLVAVGTGAEAIRESYTQQSAVIASPRLCVYAQALTKTAMLRTVASVVQAHVAGND